MTALILTPERAEIRAAIRDVTDGTASARRVADGDDPRRIDEDLARALAVEFGLAGLIVAEGDGGSGGEYADLAVVMEELGRSLAPVGLFATVAHATPLLRVLDTPVAHDLLARIATGTTRVCVIDDASVRVGPTDAHVTGEVSGVIDAVAADVFLVIASGTGGASVIAVDAHQAGVQVTPMAALDATRSFARVTLQDASGTPLGGDAERARSIAHSVAVTMLAGDQVGGMAEVLDRAVEYAKVREQFGRPIGSFQAVQHALVDLTLELESARALFLAAVDAVDAWFATPVAERKDDAVHLAAALAGAAGAASYRVVSDEALHLNGGIGFTWEHDAHLFFRRAMTDEVLLGTSERMLDRVAEAAGL